MPPLVLWTLTLLLMMFGLAGTVIPGLPGIGLVYAGIVLYALATQFASISLATVIILGLISAAALAASYAGAALGSSVGGGKKWALVGTVAGALLGATVGPLGMFAGAFLGALAGALLEGGGQRHALKVAFYSTLGTLGSIVVQFLLAVILIITFFVVI